jgi:hypothetical protein
MGSTTNGALGQIWTREAVICAIQRWAIEYGEPPTSMMWKLAHNGYPSNSTVKDRFGGWNAAIKAAGFRPRARGVLGHTDPELTIEAFTRRPSARRSR